MDSLFSLVSKSIVQVALNDRRGTFPIGTGFLVGDFKNAQKPGNALMRLITNKHVLLHDGEVCDGLTLFFNYYGVIQDVTQISVPVNDIGWEIDLHPNNNIDIASVFVPDLGIEGFVPVLSSEDMIVPIENVCEGDEVYFIGFPNGLGIRSINDRDIPILRKGMISFVDKGKKIFYIDGFAFPGNSGGPVFKKWDKKNKPSEIKLLGIISAYLPYSEILRDSSGIKRMVLYDNMGLSIAYSADGIKDVLVKPRKKRM